MQWEEVQWEEVQWEEVQIRGVASLTAPPPSSRFLLVSACAPLAASRSLSKLLLSLRQGSFAYAAPLSSCRSMCIYSAACNAHSALGWMPCVRLPTKTPPSDSLASFAHVHASSCSNCARSTRWTALIGRRPSGRITERSSRASSASCTLSSKTITQPSTERWTFLSLSFGKWQTLTLSSSLSPTCSHMRLD